MKKLFKFLLAFIMLFAFAGCNNKPDTPTDDPVNPGENENENNNNGDNGNSNTDKPVDNKYGTVHAGTLQDPFTVADAIKVAKATGETATTESYYIIGVVKSVNTSGIANYGNINIDMVDEGASDVFIAWQIVNVNGAKFTAADESLVTVGATVVVKGQILNYLGSKPETVGKGASQLVSVEGGNGNGSGNTNTSSDNLPAGLTGDGTLANPFTVADAIKVAKATGETATTGSYYIIGVVKSVNTNGIANYGNINVDMVDEGGSDVFIAWQIVNINGVKFVSGDENVVTVGATIVVKGQIVNYKSDTPETVGKGASQLVSVEGGNGNGSGNTTTPSFTLPEGLTGDGSYENPFTVADAIKVAEATGETATADEYYIIGYVQSIDTSKIAQYQNVNIYMTDEDGINVFIAWQINFIDGEGFTEEYASYILEGDCIVVKGQIVNYKGNTPETVGYGKSELVEIYEAFEEDPAITAEVKRIAEELAALFETVAIEDEYYYYSYYMLVEFEGTIDDSMTVLEDMKVLMGDSYTLVFDIEKDQWDDGEVGYFMTYECGTNYYADFGTYMDPDTNTPCLEIDVYYYETEEDYTEDEFDPVIEEEVKGIADELAALFGTVAIEDESYYYSYYLLIEFEGTIEQSMVKLSQLQALMPEAYTLISDIEKNQWLDGEVGYFMSYSYGDGYEIDFGTYMDPDTNTPWVQVDIYYYGSEQDSDFVEDVEITNTVKAMADQIGAAFNCEVIEDEYYYYSYYMIIEEEGVLADSQAKLEALQALMPEGCTLTSDIAEDTWLDGDQGYFMSYSFGEGYYIDFGTYIDSETNKLCIEVDVYYYNEVVE